MNKISMFGLVLVAATLSGCGKFDLITAYTTGSAETCVEGVSYIQFTSGVTVKYKPDGGIARCDGSSSTSASSSGVSSVSSASSMSSTSIPK